MGNFLLALLLLIGLASEAQGESWENCVVGKYQRYTETQERWQQDITDLISQTNPGLTKVAKVMRDDQLHVIEQRRIAVEYLINKKPEQLRTGKPLHAWLDLDRPDHDQISEANPRYAALRQFGEEAKRRPPHPDGDGLRHAMRTDIMKQANYKKLFRTFKENVKQVEGIHCQQ